MKRANFLSLTGYGDSSIDSSSTRLVDGEGFLMEFCEYENSDMEDYSLPDDFPEGNIVAVRNEKQPNEWNRSC